MVLARAHCGPSWVPPSKYDHRDDTIGFLINTRDNTHGFTAMESLAIHSCRVEPHSDTICNIPIVTSTRETIVIFFLTKTGQQRRLQLDDTTGGEHHTRRIGNDN
jgi:hypothetical protein